ncbi:MAG TPA: hypothetical protein VIU64_17535 [Polyangia bacterium]
MPCDTVRSEGQTLEQRNDQVKKSLTKLEQALRDNRVRVKIGANGAVAFEGWKPEDRDDVTDVCAYRTLTAQGSSALRMAVARAEAQQGRKVNPHAVAAGTHSHDGGKTWHKGH